ncbi:MAG: DUF4276 family protein [Planctomycetes bacterium]|nr:DUF4276 family protein [Planctomycetota bacterium]
MEAFLRAVAPKILGTRATFDVYQFQCKARLLEVLPRRLAGYRTWAPPGLRVVALVDRDHEPCGPLKKQMETFARRVGLATPSGKLSGEWKVANRIAIEELEAWYFGDWSAVCAAYPRVDPNTPKRRGLRDSDAIRGGTWEAFEKVLQKAGYYRGGLAKTEAAQRIGGHFDPARCRSRSFQVFRSTLLGALD